MRKMPQYKETLDLIGERTHFIEVGEKLYFERSTEMQDLYISGYLRTSDNQPYLCLYRKVIENNLTTRWNFSSFEMPNPEYAVYFTLFSRSGEQTHYCLKYDVGNNRMFLYEQDGTRYTTVGNLLDHLTWTSYLLAPRGKFNEFEFQLNRQLVEGEDIYRVEITYVKVDQARTTLPINYISA